ETTLMVAKRAHGKTWGARPNMVHWMYTMVVKPMITYASLVWWPKMQQTKAIIELSKVQRLSCLGITGAIRNTPTAAMEVLLGLPPLQFVIMGEARMGFFRLPELPSGIYEDLGHNRIKSLVGGNILDMRKDQMTPEFTHNKNFGMEIITERN
ncbi:hypothetical protein K8353_39400, partial [Burkholderia contaminans]|nr:hypothetical protein [Burkholderia contaminans]